MVIQFLMSVQYIGTGFLFQYMSDSQVHIRKKCFGFDVFPIFDVSEGENQLHKDL